MKTDGGIPNAPIDGSDYRTDAIDRQIVYTRREQLVRAGKCINGPLVGNTGHRGIIHGPVVKAGKCQRCLDVHGGDRTLKRESKATAIDKCFPELAVVDALSCGRTIRSLIRSQSMPPGTAEILDRVGRSMINAAHATLKANEKAQGAS